MKKTLYIVFGILVLIAAVYLGYVLLDSSNDSSQEVDRETAIQEAEENLDWEAAFPTIVPKYPGGKITELDIVAAEYSMFDDEVAVVVEKTTREEFDMYIEDLLEEGWVKTYEGPDGNPYNLQISLGENRISTSLNEDGILRLSSYTQAE
ncbi:MAG: hypothetical protein XD87_0121 [candidate division WS6 bacterium 36_33]|uniref:Uncharacterized protein n=1 Tax=candidate division WS6 bacterium 36_33 TaxID=1641388 RepID=A0A101GZB7_9BACT|nr:MAG: hypothetical protein XD87_0121 [candidate division WS6 bacterium 36_33]